MSLSESVTPSSTIAVVSVPGASFTFPLRTTEGRIVEVIPDTILISGHDAYHPNVGVRTTKKKLLKLLSQPKNEAIIVFTSVWEVIKNANVDKLYRLGGKAWSDFCEDIVIYYACRFILFGTPIPVVLNYNK